MAQTRTLLREIKQKFHITPYLLPFFRSNSGNPPFESLHSISTKTFIDTYYDSANLLSRKGLFVCQRGPIWESKQGLKKRTHGAVLEAKQRIDLTSYSCLDPGSTRSVFFDTSDINEVVALIAPHVDLECEIGDAIDGSVTGAKVVEAFGLDVIAKMKTRREEWMVDGEVKVIVDEMVFGHVLGMVEVFTRDVDQDSVHDRTEEFMRRYRWFFGGGYGFQGKGKLTAYFEKFGYPRG